jgi:hypothetical protein
MCCTAADIRKVRYWVAAQAEYSTDAMFKSAEGLRELKMYDKAGLVLRIETVINNPEEFRVRKQVLREGKQRAEWVALRKGVAYLFRYREISMQANARYLDALAAVDDPTPGKQALQRLTTTKKDAAGRSCAGNNAVGATRCHLVQEPDGRRALPARLHEP